MSIIGGRACDICGSDRGGYVCQCGQMRCICERDTCPTCEERREYAMQRERYESEQMERADFEDEMQEKYY